MTATTWRKSSRSGQGASNCVEVARGTRETCLRDSKAPNAGYLAFGDGQFRRFLSTIDAGRLDH